MNLLHQNVLLHLAREKNVVAGLTMKQLGYKKPNAVMKKVLRELEEKNLIEQLVKPRPQQPRYTLTAQGRKKLEKLTSQKKCLYTTNNAKPLRKKTLSRPLKSQGLAMRLEEAQKHIIQLEEQIRALQNRKSADIYLHGS